MFDRRRRVSSSSRSGGAVHELVHEWTITGYDFIKGYQIERFNSPPFQFYGFEWFIQFYPHGTTDNRENVAIFLIGKELPKAEILCSYIQFSVINQNDDAKTLRPRPYYYVLSGKDTKHNHSNSGGHINVIKSVELHDTSRGFIGEDGTLRIRLELKISCLDPMLCPHARDPRTGECRLSTTPDSSMMDVQDDSPAREAGLMPSLKSLLANEVCTDVELRVARDDSRRKSPSDTDSDSSRSSFTPFDISEDLHAPSTRHSLRAPKGDAPTLSSHATNNSLPHNAPSAANTANTHIHHPTQTNSNSFDPHDLLPSHSLNNSQMSLDLDSTLDESEFSEILNDSVASLLPHGHHLHGDSELDPNSSLLSSGGEFPPQAPPRAHTMHAPSSQSHSVLSPQRNGGLGGFPPRTPGLVSPTTAHVGPTTPATSLDPPTRSTSARPPRDSYQSLAEDSQRKQDFYSRRAHKCILASRSPVFRAMFSLRMRESVSNVVEIEDMQPEILDALLAYIYSDKEPDLQLAPAMLVVADKYQMPGLLHTCECVLARSLTLENCVSALIFADRYTFGCPHLRETTISYVCEHFQIVCRSTAFVNLMKSHTELAHEIVCEHTRMMTSVH